MAKLFYEEKRTLARRGPVEPLPPEEVEGVLLVATEPVVTWEGSHSRYGCDSVSLFPAFYGGERVWLSRCVWCPAHPYCARGTEERVLGFVDGAKLLIEKGAFEHLFQDTLQPAET